MQEYQERPCVFCGSFKRSLESWQALLQLLKVMALLGTAELCTVAPRTDCSLLLLLLQQTREPDFVDAERTMHGLSLDVFIDAYHLGTVEAAEMVTVVSTQDVEAPVLVETTGSRPKPLFCDVHGLGEEGPPHVPTAAGRPMAFSSGGDLVVERSAPTTLTAALLRTASECPQKGLTIYDSSGKPARLTYSDLLQRAGELQMRFLSRGLVAGSFAVLQIPALADHIIAFWACLLGRVRPVAVAIPPKYEEPMHAVAKKLVNVWKLLGSPVVITTAAHASQVEKLRGLPDMDDLDLFLLDEGVSDARTNITQAALAVPPDDVAFFQLSSGSTGVPKCIQITHRGVVAHIHGEAQHCAIGREDVTLNFLPFDHVVPILTVHCCDVFHGCEEVQMDVASVISEPLRWLQTLAECRVTRTWAPNFAFKLIADALQGSSLAERVEYDLSSVRYWMNAGEQVTLPVCEEFLERTRRFGVQRKTMQPAFGMAEACTCMTYNSDFATLSTTRLGRSTFINLGPPVPGVEIRIADADNQTLPEEVVGRFQIRGEVITPGYYQNDEANREAFVTDGWFNTGDVGFMKDGQLFLTGREKEMIIVRGANFYCYEIEDVVNALPSVASTFTAAVSAHDPATGSEGLAIFFVPTQDLPENRLTQVVKDIKSELVRRMGLSPGVVVRLTFEEFPKTTSGKIQRSQLARALRTGKFDARLL